MTGLRASTISTRRALHVDGARCRYSRTFGNATRGEPFWYENSLGLVEVALREDSAAVSLRLEIGSTIAL